MSQEIRKVKINSNKIHNEGYSDVYESCNICGRNMYKVNHIWVDVDDHYICAVCKKKHNIQAVKCAEI
jgi:transposase-like protein